jgi:hypothetical protein
VAGVTGASVEGVDMTLANICGSCAHTESVATTDGGKVVECAICRELTSRLAELYVVERILGERIAAVMGKGELS